MLERPAKSKSTYEKKNYALHEGTKKLRPEIEKLRYEIENSE